MELPKPSHGVKEAGARIATGVNVPVSAHELSEATVVVTPLTSGASYCRNEPVPNALVAGFPCKRDESRLGIG